MWDLGLTVQEVDEPMSKGRTEDWIPIPRDGGARRAGDSNSSRSHKNGSMAFNVHCFWNSLLALVPHYCQAMRPIDF